MTDSLAGGCLCGVVRYVVKTDTMPPCYACHCTDCQTQTGSAFGLQVPLMSDSLEISGCLREGKREMPSGSIGRIYCCTVCAVRIYAENGARPGMKILRAGTLDDSASIEPRFHLWTSSKQPWVEIPKDVEALAKQPETQQDWMQLFAGTYRAEAGG